MNRSLTRRTASVLGALAAALAGGLAVLTPAPAAAAAPPYGPAPVALAGLSVRGLGVVLGDRLYFPAQDTSHGVELWSTDGTPGGTRMVTDLVPGGIGSNPAELVVMGGRIYFRASDGITGSELWSTDGTAAGTQLVYDIVAGGNSSVPLDLTVAGDRVYFTAFRADVGRELWASTGRLTYLVADLRPGFQDGEVDNLTAFGSKLLFSGEQLPGVSKPWVTSGAAVARLDDYAPETDLDVGTFAPEIGGRVVFAAGDERSGREIWVTKGMPGDADGLIDITVGASSSNPQLFTRVGSLVYFTPTRMAEGRELWVSDGTPGGTQLVRDIREGSTSSGPLNLTEVNEQYLAFTANDGLHGAELWISRGSAATTQMVRDLSPGTGDGAAHGVASLAEVGGHLVFAGKDVNGSEPWITDGTAAGTRPIADLTQGSSSSNPAPVGVLGNTVVFVNLTGVGGVWAYTVTPSRTSATPKASYSLAKAKQRKISIPVRVVAAGTRPTGTVTLTLAGRTVGRATLVDGAARVRITRRLGKGKHRMVATYVGSSVARASQSVPFKVRVR